MSDNQAYNISGDMYRLHRYICRCKSNYYTNMVMMAPVIMDMEFLKKHKCQCVLYIFVELPSPL